MNWTDGVELGADILPRWLVRAVAITLMVLMVMPGHPGMRLFMAFADAKASGILHEFNRVFPPQPAPSGRPAGLSPRGHAGHLAPAH